MFLYMHFRENTKLNSLISASNNFEIRMDINCEANTPTTIPIANDIIPTNIVSNNIILDICLFPIPKRHINSKLFFSPIY